MSRTKTTCGGLDVDWLVETPCEFNDFCEKIRAEWEAYLVADGHAPDRKHGPQAGLCDSEMMTLVVLYHSSQFYNFKTFYNGIVLQLAAALFRHAPCYQRFITLNERVWALLALFLASRMGQKTRHRQYRSPGLSRSADRQTQGFRGSGRPGQNQHGLVFRLSQAASGVQSSA